MIKTIIIIISISIPAISFADMGLKFSCTNMLSMLGKKYEPENYKLETTGFHYFDEKLNKFLIIPSKEIEFGESRFTVKLTDYELGFQKIFFHDEIKPTVTMSKYDFINNKFIDHYKCKLKKTAIN